MVDKPFVYPERIPAARANAIRQLVLERPELSTWRILRAWVEEIGLVKVLQEISIILERNSLDVVAQAKLLELWSLHLIIRNYPPCYTCDHFEVVVVDKEGNPISGYCWDCESDMGGSTGCSNHTELDNETNDDQS
jgi:hypothetical protein